MLSMKLILITCLNLIIFFELAKAQALSKEENVLPMEASYEMNFKTNLRWYSEDCYFHYLKNKDILHIIINVMSGGDLSVDLTVFDPTNYVLHFKEQLPFHWYDNSEISLTGNYKICIRNVEHHEKKVYINIVSFSKAGIEQKTMQMQKLNETSSYLMQRIESINENVHSMRRCQILQRMIHAGDSYFIEANYEYVQFHSILQSIVIVLSALIQTYFIKKLFQEPSSLKPRA